MPILPAEAHRNKINALAIKNDKGVIVDYKNPFPVGSDQAKFVDALSVNGKKMLYENQYAFDTFGWAVSAEGLEKALEKADVIVSLHPPQNSDPYADAKKYYSTQGSFKDFLLGAATLALPMATPTLVSSVGSALGATGSTAAALGNAVIGGALAEAKGGDFLKGAATSGITSLLQTDVAPAAARSVGGGTLGNVVSGALTGGVTSALKGGDVLTGAISGGIDGLKAPLSETNASFMAADAIQLAEQGLSESQISETLSAGYASTTAADLAASLAVGQTKPSVAKIEKELDKLSKTVGLTPVETTDPELVAADALGIAEAAARDNNFANTGLDNELLKGGVDIGAIEQNLTASGIDPLVATDVANEVALNPNISVGDLSNYIEDFYGKTVYDVPNLEFDPTEPPDTRPEGETLVDTTKEAITPTPVVTTPFVSTGAPTGGLFSQPTTTATAPQDPYNFGANIAFGNTYQNPFARERSERQSLISGLFNL